MITKRQYENAIATVKRYQEEQEQIKLSKINCENVTPETRIRDMYLAGVISARLYGVLYRCFDFNVKFEVILSEIDVDKFHLMYGVGERTIKEFLKLMEHETN
jgi:hypothetical protein